MKLRHALLPLTASAALVAALITPQSSLVADNAPTSARASDGQLVAAFDRAANAKGHFSAADRQLVLSRPEVAAVTVDVDSGTLDTGIALAAYATRSRTVDRYVRYYSLTGGAVIDYHFTVGWGYNGDKVINTPTRGHYIVSYTEGMYDRGLASTGVMNQPGPYAWTIDGQGTWEQCIAKYGCFAGGAPFTRFGVYFDGTYSYYARASN